MRALLILLTIASIPLGHFMAERPAETDARMQVADDDTPRIPLLTAEPGLAGPLFYRKAERGSPGDAVMQAGGLPRECVSDQALRLLFRAAAALPAGPVLPELHLRI